MPSRTALATILVGAAFAAGAIPAGASSPARAAKTRDCRVKTPGTSRRSFALSKFFKLKATALGCKTARKVAYQMFQRADKGCWPPLANGGTRTCTVLRYRCRTHNKKNTGTYTGTCVRGSRRIAFSYGA